MRNLGILSSLLLLLTLADSIEACSCNVVYTPKTEFHKAEAVFVGEVEKYDPITEVASVRITEAFKGGIAVGEVLTVGSPLSGEACGYGPELNAGTKHLFWAAGPWHQPADFSVDYCGRTATVELSGCVIETLEKRARWWRNPLSRLRILRWLGVSLGSCPHPRFAG